MRRYFLKNRDRATNGATVMESFDADTHYGVALTFVGARMACPVCKSTGVIVATGPCMPGLRVNDRSKLLATGVTDANDHTARVSADTASRVMIEINDIRHAKEARP
jgi:hypothetical protein